MNVLWRRPTAIVMLAMLSGCGSDGASTAEDGSGGHSATSEVCGEPTDSFSAGMTKDTDAGSFAVTIVEATPAPPARYDNSWSLEISDSAGVPVDGATVRVSGWMPEHGHGTPRDADVSPLGGGQYEAAPINLFMPGVWQVTVEVASDDATDEATFVFCIEG